MDLGILYLISNYSVYYLKGIAGQTIKYLREYKKYLYCLKTSQNIHVFKNTCLLLWLQMVYLISLCKNASINFK